MTVKLILPVPLDNREVFDAPLQRCLNSLRQFDPGVDYELVAVLNNGPLPDDMADWFKGLPVQFLRYNGQGFNVGSAQAALSVCFDEDLMVCLSSRCYFHREDWLYAYTEAVGCYGDGIYGTGTHEGRTHIRLCGFGIQAELFRRFPYQILTEEDGHRAESGDWCLSDFVQRSSGSLIQVGWTRDYPISGWRQPPNIFRRGDQSNLLIWDKWSDHYAAASPEEKAILEAKTNPSAP